MKVGDTVQLNIDALKTFTIVKNAPKTARLIEIPDNGTRGIVIISEDLIDIRPTTVKIHSSWLEILPKRKLSFKQIY